VAKRECYICKGKVKENVTVYGHYKSELSTTSHMKWYQTWKGLLLILFILGVFIGACEEKPTSVALNEANKNSENNDQTDEKSKLLNSYFGDFQQAKKVKSQAKESLRVWEPQVKYSLTLSPALRKVMLDGVTQLDIEYDEIWTSDNDGGLGKNDIYKLYWKENKVQACTIEKYYDSDPLTGEKLSEPSHKIWNIYSRYPRASPWHLLKIQLRLP